MSEPTGDGFRSGFATVVGRPNVGKSTLINRLMGQKISITSRRPQTTRHRILAIRTEADSQLILVDTPGLHTENKQTMNRLINRAARSSLEGVDVIVLMINARGWTAADEMPLELVRERKVPVILAINKVDRLKDKTPLLPLIDASRRRFGFEEIVPLSALKGTNVDALYDSLRRLLPEAPQCFPDDQITDRSTRFVVSELIREQIFRQLGDELPYVSAVQLTGYEEEERLIRVQANIWVERDSHKGIVIGKGGERLKALGSSAREQIEAFVDKRAHLDIRVRVRRGWRDDEGALEGLGYLDDW